MQKITKTLWFFCDFGPRNLWFSDGPKCGPGTFSVDGIPNMVWPWEQDRIVKYARKNLLSLKRKRIAAFVAVSALLLLLCNPRKWLLVSIPTYRLDRSCCTGKLTAAVCASCSSRTMKSEHSVNHKRVCDRCWQKKLDSGEEIDSTPAPAIRRKSLFEKASAVRSWGDRVAVRTVKSLNSCKNINPRKHDVWIALLRYYSQQAFVFELLVALLIRT